MNSATGIPTWNNIYKYLTFNPTLIIIVIVVIILYLLFFGSLGSGNIESQEGESGGMKLLGIILGSIFLVLLVINGFNYFLNINIIASIKNFFSKTPEIDIIAESKELSGGQEEVPEIKTIKQVYNIPENIYTYGDAKALCSAYGNRLATIKEVKSALDSGGEWCNYGWSEDQMALFPTQYETWEKLQKIQGHENDCGRPGINGGYIDNPNIRFGVNCYGYKPKITPQEAEIMKKSFHIYSKTNNA